MEVNVKYLLARGDPVRLRKMITLTSHAAPWQRACHSMNEPEGFRSFVFAQVVKSRSMHSRHYEDMPRIDLIDVHECHCVVALGDEAGFDIS